MRAVRFVLRRPGEIDRLLGEAAIPDDVKRLIRTVVSKTKLWPGEKADIARELIDHARDAVATERSAASIIDQFGEPKTAAKLIRRARKRQRHPVTRAWTAAVRCAVVSPIALALLWGVLWVRFHAGDPIVSVSYINQLKARQPDPGPGTPPYIIYETAKIRWNDLAIPIDERVDTTLPLDSEFSRTPANDLRALDPAHPAYDDIIATFRAFAPNLDGVVEAAARPAHGLPYSMDITFSEEQRDRELPAEERVYGLIPMPTAAADQPPMWGVLLPHLGSMRQAGFMLAFDARLAATDGDAQRIASRLTAIVDLADQSANDGFIISSLVSQALVGVAAEELALVIRDHPGLLSDADLSALSHRLAAGIDRATALDLSTERMMIKDVLQRTFTDNGRGGGRLTNESSGRLVNLGLRYTDELPGLYPGDTAVEILLPIAALLVADRQTQLDIAMRHMAIAESTLARGPSAMPELLQAASDLEEHFRSPWARWRYVVLSYFLANFERSIGASFKARAKTEGTLIAVAALLYERDHREPPASLDDLVPRYFPEAPEDPFDPGNPLRITRTDGRLTVYSVGQDGVDDAGTPLLDARRRPATHSMNHRFRPGGVPESGRRALPQSLPGERVTGPGDWVIYPPAADTR